jgi:hypothetical protein
MNVSDLFLNHAKEELEKINMLNQPIGEAVLRLIEESVKISGNNATVISMLCQMPFKLVDNQVLSPITEEDFEEQFDENPSGDPVKVLRCKRRYSVYKDLSNDTYYDDKGIAYINVNDPQQNKMYIYQGSFNSKVKIDLPYSAQEQIVYIN